MISTMMPSVYVFCMMAACVLIADHVLGEMYSFQTVTWTETTNRCLLANQSTICNPDSTFCDVKDTIDDTSLIDGYNSTWIGGFYYKSMWITYIGCVALVDAELEFTAVRHDLGDENNIEHCIVSCGSTTPSIGLVNETCYCINITRTSLRFLPNEMCTLPCPGNPFEICGAPQTNPTLPKFLTVYQRVEEQSTETEEREDMGNCRAISYNSTSDYQIFTRNCSEQLSFTCKSLYTVPSFYNFGNYTWEEARVYCQQLNFFLADSFAIYLQPETLEFNTLYWIGNFRVENYYWGYDLPMVRYDDPVLQCLSINRLNDMYSVERNDCNSSLSAFCLPQTIEITTMPEQSSTEDYMTTEMESNSTDSSTEISTDSNNATSTGVFSSYTMSSVSTQDMSTETQAEMSTDSTMSSIPITDDATFSSTKTMLSSTSTMYSATVTDNFSSPAGQAELLTSSTAMYIGVGAGALVLLAGIPIIAIIVLRRKQKIRESVTRLEASVYDVTHRRSKRDREIMVDKLQDDQF